MKLHVLHIARWYPNNYDVQIGVFIKKHVEAAALHHQSTLIYVHRVTSLSENKLLNVTEENGVKSYILYFNKRKIPGINLLLYVYYHFKIIKLIIAQEGKPQLIHTHVQYGLSLITYWVHLFYGIPYIISEHWNGFTNEKFAEKDLLFKKITQFVCKRAAAVTCVSNFLRQGLVKYKMAKTIQLVPNIIEALPTQNSITNDYKVHILTVADLDDAVKNISGIINALATLKHSGTNNFLYEIIGEGKDHERLKAQSQQLGMGECIRFLGIKSNKEVLQAIHQCNFVVINSRVETFSVFLGEAMMTGKPAICTACGGPEEFFDNNCGLMIEVDNQAQLIAALKHMIVNYGTYHSHQIKGVVSKKYSKEVIGQQFSDIYETVIGQK